MFVSSGGTVYGDNGMVASRENDPTIPMNAYGAHKLLIENYLRVFSYAVQQDYLILRLSNPYGPLQSVTKGVGLIAAVIDAIKMVVPSMFMEMVKRSEITFTSEMWFARWSTR
ncbi:NAD-dependent epimerase/dehydratase family protein [Ochrobactrum cytisi]|nr:NAD-dependent epimerase/dehydratase family protein [Brucella cytisi]